MNESRIVKLSEVCDIVSGSTPKTNILEYWEGNLKWITPAEITDKEKLISDTERHISAAAVCQAHLRLLPKGTVLFSSRAPIGKVAIAGEEMYCNQGFKNLVCSSEILNEYLYYYLKYNADYIKSIGRGATFKEVSKEQVGNLTIVLPEISEQLRRSKVLSLIDRLIENYDKQLGGLSEIQKSRFIEMFGSSKKEMVDKWETRQLISCVESIESGKSLVCNTFPQQNNEPAILKLSSISSGHFLPGENKSMVDSSNLDRSKLVSKGDILLTRKNTPELVGLNVLVNQDTQNLMFPDIIFRMHPKSSIKGEYLSMLLMTKDFLSEIQAISHGSSKSMSNIPKSKLAEVIIPIPPILLQHHFIEQKLLIDKSKLAIQKSIDELETLKKSLMQEYFG